MFNVFAFNNASVEIYKARNFIIEIYGITIIICKAFEE